MNPTPRTIQRTYLVLMLGNTLAASFIWGINTIFLLDAGLSNLEAFAANAFFTAGMVLFEVPTGIVADTRRPARVVPARHGHADASRRCSTCCCGRSRRRSGRGRSSSLALGLGFTFFSGAVEAWLVDALTATGFTGELETVFGRGQIVGGVAMLTGSLAGGFIAAASSLGTPFVVRAAVLVVMFVVAFRLMHDIGFTPEQGGRPLAEMRRIATESIDYGWRVPAVKWLMVQALFTGGVGIYGFYALQPYLLELYGDPRGLRDRRAVGGDRAGAQILGGLAAPRIRAALPRRTSALLLTAALSSVTLALVGMFENFWAVIGLVVVWAPAVRGHDADPPGLPERHDPLPPARDDPVLRLADGLDRRRLGAAGARPRRRRLGLRADVPDGRGDLGARAAVHRALAPPERARGPSRGPAGRRGEDAEVRRRTPGRR